MPARGARIRLRRAEPSTSATWLIDRRGGHGPQEHEGRGQLAGSASAIVLGTVLDGIPESFVLGGSLAEDGIVPIAVVVGVFVSNVPEALSGHDRAAARPAGRERASSPCGARSLPHRSSRPLLGWRLHRRPWGARAALSRSAFAAGALLVMLSDTLMPEAFELGGREAGLLTALGFALGFALS